MSVPKRFKTKCQKINLTKHKVVFSSVNLITKLNKNILFITNFSKKKVKSVVV